MDETAITPTAQQPQYRIFSNTENSYQGLQELYENRYLPVNMRELIDIILDNNPGFNPGREVIITPSLRITPPYKAGEEQIVYTHESEYFYFPQHIKTSAETQKNGAGTYPLSELYRATQIADGMQTIVLTGEAVHADSGIMNLDDASKNPHAKAIIGPRIGEYLEWYSKNIGEFIEIYHKLDHDAVPRARLLAMNLHTKDHGYGSFGASHIGKGAAFLGKTV